MKHYIVILILMILSVQTFAQRQMEYLDRGIVAMRPSTSQVLINWRITGPEYADNATYNLYRGSTLIASGLTVSNYVDATSNNESYSVSAVINGVEKSKSKAVTPLANQYFTIPVRPINGVYDAYNINDASVGDLDGDGEYEIVVKRLANDCTPASTNYHYLEAYKLDGTFLWAINLGPNICNTVEVNFLVYDLDGDGKAEIATRTSDGMIDGTGVNIGDRDNDGKTNYRSTMAFNSSYYRIDGPDYISIFNGQTGKEIAWDWYINREPMSQWGPAGLNDSQLSHRATKCMWSVAYTDGVNPSFIIGRGIYERIKLEAWHFRNGKLTKEWGWDSDPNGVASEYHGSGFHNLAVGDVDGDGRDELMYGSMAIDEYGKGMYSQRYGHGDAGHLADINPDKTGLEFFSCLEGGNGTTIPGLSLRNATTGASLWKLNATGDIGRCMTADIDPKYKGMEIWGSGDGNIYSCTGDVVANVQPTTAGNGATYNFGIWWDGDLQRELVDRTVITKWNSTNKSTDRVATLYNITSISANNSTKSNPCLMADILGDWREEVIFRKSDNTGMVVFVTPFSTTQRMYTLMHDKNYRTAISWQNMSYNQPPNLSFYFGGGMATPPNPNIKIVKVNTAPSIKLVAPADKITVKVGQKVTLTATVEDDGDIANVVFYATNKATNNMVAISTQTGTKTSYSYDWIAPEAGTYYLVAKTTDAGGITVNSNIPTIHVNSNPETYVYLGTTGDLMYETAGNWDKGIIPSSIDTAIIRTGEAKVNGEIQTTLVKVESNGIFRMIGYYTIPNIILQGGMLKVFTSGTTYGVNSSVKVEKASTIMAGSTTVSPFLCDAVFSGTEDLTKTSVGILQLQKSSPNFSGDWYLSEGTTQTKAAHAVGSGNVIVNSAAILDLKTVGGIAGCDTLIVKSGATVTVAVADTVKNLKVNGSTVPKGIYTASTFPQGITGAGTLVVLNGDDITSTLISKKTPGVILEVFPNPMTVNGGIKYASKFTGDHKLVIYSGTKTENARTIALEDNAGVIKFSELALTESGVYVAILYNGKKEIGRISFYY